VSRVSRFGPLIISIDAKGNNLVDDNKAIFNARKTAIVEEIGRQVRFIK
jgi:L(+)-tartrate dehydratase beta subunit